MQELKKQVEEYNGFIEQLCTFYRNGIKEEHKDDFIKWIVVTAGNLYILPDTGAPLGAPPERVSQRTRSALTVKYSYRYI